MAGALQAGAASKMKTAAQKYRVTRRLRSRALTQHPLPAGQGQAVELAQLHLLVPELPAVGQTQ